MERDGRAALGLLDPDIEYVIDPPASLAGTYRGLAQFKWLDSRGAKLFDEFALSGASAIQKGCGVWELREGRIVRVRMYFDCGEALRDAGLAE